LIDFQSSESEFLINNVYEFFLITIFFITNHHPLAMQASFAQFFAPVRDIILAHCYVPLRNSVEFP
jgi:hypothetical protein